MSETSTKRNFGPAWRKDGGTFGAPVKAPSPVENGHGTARRRVAARRSAPLPAARPGGRHAWNGTRDHRGPARPRGVSNAESQGSEASGPKAPPDKGPRAPRDPPPGGKDRDRTWERGMSVPQRNLGGDKLWDEPDLDDETFGDGAGASALSSWAEAAQAFEAEMRAMREKGGGQLPGGDLGTPDMFGAAFSGDADGADIDKAAREERARAAKALESLEAAASAPPPAPGLAAPARKDDDDGSWRVKPWFYKDPQGQHQGPFEAPQMRQWFNAGYFDDDLPLRQGESGDFVPLGRLFSSPQDAFPARRRRPSGAAGPGGALVDVGGGDKPAAPPQPPRNESLENWQDQANALGGYGQRAPIPLGGLEALGGAPLQPKAARPAQPAPAPSDADALKMMLGGGAPAPAPKPAPAPAPPRRASRPGSRRPRAAAPRSGRGRRGPTRRSASRRSSSRRRRRAPSSSGSSRPSAPPPRRARPPRRSRRREAPWRASRSSTASSPRPSRRAAASPAPSSAPLRQQNRPAAAPAARAAPPAAAKSAFGGPVATSNPDALQTWCKTQLKKINGSDDITLIQFCMTLTDNSEIRQYLSMYLGSTPQVAAFANEFIKRKQGKVPAAAAAAPAPAPKQQAAHSDAPQAQGASSKSRRRGRRAKAGA
ncbi:GYF domain containing protein [Aureococcus anophagefferens]|nr:GYF domain containing protein [Aureococcus anophagefferens]